VAGGTHGGALNYNPNSGLNGMDSFTYKANYGVADSAPATVEIAVNPTIADMIPGPGSTTQDRSPTIAATVRDVETELTGSQISLHLDAASRNFSYDQTADQLTFTPSRRLTFGSHTVRIGNLELPGGSAAVKRSRVNSRGRDSSADDYRLDRIECGVYSSPNSILATTMPPASTVRQMELRSTTSSTTASR
jgi:hypothetical protein